VGRAQLESPVEGGKTKTPFARLAALGADELAVKILALAGDAEIIRAIERNAELGAEGHALHDPPRHPADEVAQLSSFLRPCRTGRYVVIRLPRQS
jgi:hypothetical protein